MVLFLCNTRWSVLLSEELPAPSLLGRMEGCSAGTGPATAPPPAPTSTQGPLAGRGAQEGRPSSCVLRLP